MFETWQLVGSVLLHTAEAEVLALRSRQQDMDRNRSGGCGRQPIRLPEGVADLRRKWPAGIRWIPDRCPSTMLAPFRTGASDMHSQSFHHILP